MKKNNLLFKSLLIVVLTTQVSACKGAPHTISSVPTTPTTITAALVPTELPVSTTSPLEKTPTQEIPLTASNPPLGMIWVENFAAYLEKLASDNQFSGAVLVAQGDKVRLERAYGLADRSGNILNQGNSKFNLGSMNKMFTAVAILQLMEKGKLSLDDTIKVHLPEYPNNQVAEMVTIHHLLTHTSGLGDVFTEEFSADPHHYRSNADYLPLFVDEPLHFKPGERFSYSNAGFVVLGLVIEQVSGQTYDVYIKENIFDPCDMRNTSSFDIESRPPNLVIGYTTKDEDGNETGVLSNNFELLPGKGFAAGGGYSTVEDLLRFRHALLNNELLGPEATELLITGKVVMSETSNYAYGFMDRMVGEQRAVGHTGGAPGICSFMLMFPESGYTMIVLSNSDNGCILMLDYLKISPPTDSNTDATPCTEPSQPHEVPPAGNDWQQIYRMPGSEIVNDVLMAEDGGYYIVGTKNLVYTPEQNGDIYVIRIDAAGQKLWERTYGGEKLDEGRTIFLTSDGQLMIIGYTTSFHSEGIDVYMIKVDQSGNELWSKTLGGPLDEMGSGRQIADGGFILSGSIVDPNEGVADPGSAGYAGFAGRSNIFIARTDGEGNPLWMRAFGGELNVLSMAGVQTSDNGFVILASIITYPNPGNHIHLLKVDKDGQEIWSRTWGKDNASGSAIVQTDDGGYLITGPYLAPGSEKEDFLFIKTDAEGKEIWRSSFGDPDMVDYGVVMVEAADGGYVAAGEWVKDYYSGNSDLLLIKINAQGQLVQQQKIEVNSHHMLARILPHPDGGYVIATSVMNEKNSEFDIMLMKIDAQVLAAPTHITTP